MTDNTAQSWQHTCLFYEKLYPVEPWTSMNEEKFFKEVDMLLAKYDEKHRSFFYAKIFDHATKFLTKVDRRESLVTGNHIT